ncbi:hypothetical protein A6U87_21210 [Rhizobium sp. AC44/96]|uniref:DUF2147 domain-containing protein n=1 Tax=unclassified Rhizobium TaxID=2613769 RepID=UPI00080FD395|nr:MULTISPECIES: DUF2147 domain-containing protein [unclassified Rhizobium]MDM9623346.1 DUF2147 domain-containing protein [Rhizobium sp. S96]OCJ17353.1 hypothetical protein A6U87_21210 [Rhizobium sp. AC44/96]
MKSCILTAAVFAWGHAGIALAAEIDGQWARGDGNATVIIAPCGSDICAVNTWIKPGTPKEKKGDKLVMTIKSGADGVYSGRAYDPQRELTYNLTVTVTGDKMTTRGCIVAGILCKAIDWTRMN